ncbi:hypothetical protein M3P05_20090 [Sansalvadorimonas sp. 2012CJ34-2]|uniref:Uncharacterized protein n=1 Tax=Parendozoicomonas callyspongiae TaxID=2942213 RepID=A0ABT0PLU2_9GAMM|nr:hypothetical protein [Sansalvadorimonas sp. 2012CJ34-2]MCL6272226.1 hypothetical protein [Sansalvadorimonas sp. 2012CJ34-2]
MSSSDYETKELTKEKKLWDVYWASRRLPHSKFNTITTIMVFILLIINSWLTQQPIDETLKFVREISSSGLSISLSTLGFLLSGFTIFATVSQPSLFLGMSEIPHPDSGLSYLKHNFFIFLRVFIFYIAFATLCLLITVLGHKGGLISLLVSYSPHPEEIKFTLVKIAYIFICTFYYFLLMQLKSFVFNIYHAVMTSLRWKAEGYE